MGRPAYKPKEGEITKVIKHNTHFWLTCPDCGKQRWVRIGKGFKSGIKGLCQKCAVKRFPPPHRCGANSPLWKGGKGKDCEGYIFISITPNDPYYSMSRKKGQGRVREHRYVMAQYLGRCLLPWEIVHHKNRIRDDNRIENLELLPDTVKHNTQMSLMRKDCLLKKEIRLLRWQIKEMAEQLQGRLIEKI